MFPAAQAVVQVGLAGGHAAQAVADLEMELLPVLVAQVALRVVLQADHRRTAAVTDAGQAVAGVVQILGVVLHARLRPRRQIVQRVVAEAVGVIAAAEGRRDRPGQAIEAVVLQRAMLQRRRTGHVVVDLHRIAVAVVAVGEVQRVARARHPRRQLPRVLGHRLHQTVAVSEALDRTVRVVRDPGGVGHRGLLRVAHHGRLAQRVRGVA